MADLFYAFDAQKRVVTANKDVTAADFYVQTKSDGSETAAQCQARWRSEPEKCVVYLKSEVSNVAVYVSGGGGGSDVVTVTTIDQVKDWLKELAMSRDGASLDTSIWLKTVVANAAVEVMLERKDGVAISGNGWTGGVYRLVETQASINAAPNPYSIDPYNSVMRFNREGVGTGLPAATYYINARQPTNRNKVLKMELVLGASSARTPFATAPTDTVDGTEPTPGSGEGVTNDYDGGQMDTQPSAMNDPDGQAADTDQGQVLPVN